MPTKTVDGHDLLMNRRRRYSSAAMASAMLAAALSVTTSCDSTSQDPKLTNGWVTNCSGPEFSRFSGDVQSGPGPTRPVFKIDDQLVVAVPQSNRPSAGSIEREPRECRKISDLQPVSFIYFTVQGDWSAGYKQPDIPIVAGRRQFQPDVVTVRIEREAPDTLSPEEHQQIKNMLRDSLQSNSTGTQEFGRMTCFVPQPAVTWFHCSGRRTMSAADVTELRFRKYSATPFVLILAEYSSSRYGGIHVYWQTWISDPSHAMDVDEAIWNSIEDWNLVDVPVAASQGGMN